jgi:hypothetical protein
MEPQRLHKSYQYWLTPTPAQEQALEVVVLRCRTLDTCALEQRKTWWERGRVSVPRTLSRQGKCPI